MRFAVIFGLSFFLLLTQARTTGFSVFITVITKESIKFLLIHFNAQISFLNQPLNQSIDQLIELLVASLAIFIEELLILFLIEEPGIAERLADRPA